MFDSLQESKSAAALEKALDSLTQEDKAQIKKQILSGGLADWLMHLRQLFPKEAEELADYVRGFYTVKEQAEIPRFDSIEHYLHHRRMNCGSK